MRALPILALAALAACSEQPPAPEQGALWPHRDRIAEALQVRSGQLAGSMRKPVRACRRYWETGVAGDAALPPETCDQAATRLAARLDIYLGTKVAAADVRDPALWRYVAERAKL